MLRRDVAITLTPLDAAEAREAVERHHRDQPYSGDFFIGSRQVAGPHRAIAIDGERAGIAAVGEDGLSLCLLDPRRRRYERQAVEAVLAETEVRSAYAVSWDRHHVELFGNFATDIDNQAYQFQLLDPDDLCTPRPGLTLTTADESDLDYLHGAGFIDDFTDLVATGQTRVARLGGRNVGIGIVAPHKLNAARYDIGMFTEPDVRESGIGRSILSLAAREVLDRGAIPVAGCWWRNFASRRTLEAAGLTCVGTIFRFTLDPDRFTAE